MHLSVVLALSLNLLAEATAIPRVIPRDVGLAEEYDYIVVGGGLSGLTVANRLSETDASKSYSSVRTRIPAYTPSSSACH